MARNPFQHSAPAHDASTVTPSDTVNLTNEARGLYIGTTGNVRVTTRNGTDLIFYSVPAGGILPVYVRRVWTTNTSASNITALY